MKKRMFNGGLTRFWWIPLVTGVLSLAIGIWCLCSPVSSLPVLAYVFAGCICAAGVLNIIYGIINTAPHSNWGWSLALGLFEIIIGVWLFMMPQAVLVTTFIYTIGIYLVVVTINAICEACVLSTYANDWVVWMLGFLFATLIFAIIFLAGPIAGGIVVWLYIGISLITFGIYRIMLSAKLRKINRMIRF